MKPREVSDLDIQEMAVEASAIPYAEWSRDSTSLDNSGMSRDEWNEFREIMEGEG